MSRDRNAPNPSESEVDQTVFNPGGAGTVNQPVPHRPHSRAIFIRALALLCACSLSVGSHYASYILAPLKSRLSREMGTSHSEFSLLISAFSLNSTWTPLVGGVLASTLGTTFASILATGVIFVGQLLLLMGNISSNVRLMAFGLFIFGLGVSPLAVVQETIIIRFFKSHGLGISMALGLIAGKGASFLAAHTTYPLTKRFGSRAPFYVATGLAGLSVVVNLIYVASSKWLAKAAGAEMEVADMIDGAQPQSVADMTEEEVLERVAAKRRVNLRGLTGLGDVFWTYIGLNVLCGMIWSPFLHLAANIIELRYVLDEETAANIASYLLAGSVILYPICGLVVDRFGNRRPIVIYLLALSSILTDLSYAWLVIPPTWTKSPIPAIAIFAFGQGFAPLLLVLLVPKIVEYKYISTALGSHKSLEQTGSTIFQTLAGLSLDLHQVDDGKSRYSAIQNLLNTFLCLNILQLSTIMLLAHLQHLKRRDLPPSENQRLASPDSSEISNAQETQPLLQNVPRPPNYSSGNDSDTTPKINQARSKTEELRGEFFVYLSGFLIIAAWILFLVTAWFRLGLKKGKP